MENKNIVVLCGGTSTERDVSLVTSKGVCNALRAKGHKAILLDVFLGLDSFVGFTDYYDVEAALLDIQKRGKDIKNIKKTRKSFLGPNVLRICNEADVVFLGLHGSNGEDGKIQATFDLMGIKYTGCDCLPSAMAMSKAVTKAIFKAYDVPQSNGYAINKKQPYCTPDEMGVKYPVVIKPSCGGSSIGVFFANDYAEFVDGLNACFKYEDEVIIEEKVSGREFSVGVIGYDALPVIEIIADGNYDYENKYNGLTKEVCPAQISDELTKKIQDAAVKAAKALKLDVYCRVDVLTDENENCYCLEANTLPGMTPTSLLPQEAAVIGIDYNSLCEKLIEISLKSR
ncbi:MAG: D-alanine--D-alanine ligase [Lachnospiraceae bacterium]|nr:D-alanine--D-alanine ligase [Lachnospiraceae bacterium]